MLPDITVVLAIALGFFVQSVFGFASGLISIPIISLVLGVKDAVSLVLIFQVSLGIIIFKLHKHVDWKLAAKLLTGALIGVPIGTILLSSLHPTYLYLTLSASIFLMIPFLKKEDSILSSLADHPYSAYIFGLVFGSIQSLFGIAGPIAVICISCKTKNKDALRATSIFTFACTNALRLIISINKSLITPALATQAAYLAPVFLLSIYLGDKFSRKGISDEKFYLWVKIILCFSAISILLKTL